MPSSAALAAAACAATVVKSALPALSLIFRTHSSDTHVAGEDRLQPTNLRPPSKKSHLEKLAAAEQPDSRDWLRLGSSSIVAIAARSHQLLLARFRPAQWEARSLRRAPGRQVLKGQQASASLQEMGMYFHGQYDVHGYAKT